MFDFLITRRRRNWRWRVRDPNGVAIVGGLEKSRPAARYHAYRALLHLLATKADPKAIAGSDQVTP